MSNKTTTQKFIDYFQNLDEALKYDKVQCIIKIGDNFFPKSISTTMAPCLCEFTKENIIFNSCNTGIPFWKNTIKLIKKVSYTDISRINLSITRRLNAVLGIFPTYFLNLQIDILLNNKDQFSLECNTFEQVPELLKILNMNKVEVIDKFNLHDLYKSKTHDEVSEYLHTNYEDIIENIN